MNNDNGTINNNPREQKGKEIALKSDLIRVSDYHYHVHSQTTFRDYDVIRVDGRWTCTCPDHSYRNRICCKHIHAVEFSIKIRNEVREKNQTIIEQLSYDKCPQCQSNNIVKHGIRHNKKYDLQRFSCRNCNKRFSFNLGFEGMKASPQIITSSMQLYFTGESLRNVQKFIKLQGVEVSHQTIYNWIKKYTKLMEQYVSKIVPQVGDAWRADELWIKVKGDLKYLFALMDDETRFLIAKEVSDKKEGADASGLFRQAKEITQTKPKVLITDGLRSYHDAYLKEFWTQKRETRTIHVNHIHLKGDRNNNKMERLNGEIRDREKVVRGLKKTDSPLISGYQIYHNYVRPHSALENKTPAEACGIKITGNNKWLTLIQNASKI